MADTTVRTIDPSKVKVSLGVFGVVSGYAEGSFIKITRAGKAFEKKRGAGGSVERIAKNIFDFEVELTLLQSSPWNAILSGALNADILSNDGVFPLTITDFSGPTDAPSVFAAPQAWVEKDADVTYADSSQNRTWKIATGPATNFIAGN